MTKSICFIYTITTGSHKTTDFCSKKNLYCFARLVSLKYEICTFINKKYTIQKTSNDIIIPRCMYIPDEFNILYNINQKNAISNGVEIENVLDTFIKDISDVDIIVCHNPQHHLNAIIGEAVRYNINMNLSKYLIIDISNFYGKYDNIKESYIKLIHNDTNDIDNNIDILSMIRIIFFIIYIKFKKSLKIK